MDVQQDDDEAEDEEEEELEGTASHLGELEDNPGSDGEEGAPSEVGTSVSGLASWVMSHSGRRVHRAPRCGSGGWGADQGGRSRSMRILEL